MRNPFWSVQEKRLRALWRIIIQLMLFIIITGILILGSGFLLANPQEFQEVASGAGLRPLVTILLSAATLCGMVASLWLMARFIDKRAFVDFGFQCDGHWWRDFAVGLGLGIGLMAGVFIFELTVGWVSITEVFAVPSGETFALAIAVLLFQFIAVGIYEEMFSRGYQLLNMAEGFRFLGRRKAVILAWLLSSAVFGVLHITNPNASLLSTFNIIIAGLMLGLPVVLTRSLALSIGLHISWNFAQGNIFGFPVSGTGVNQTTFIAVQQGGPDFWTGGAFGPEAGFLGLIAMAVGAVIILAWTHYRRGSAQLDYRLVEYGEKAKRNKNAD